MPTRGASWVEKTLDTPPSAAREFVAGDEVTAAVDIYAPPATGGPIEVFADVEGVDPAPRRLAPRPAGASTLFRIDTTTLKPGPYVLRIVAAEGTERVERRVSFAVVNPR
jgi:hypothetical protein